jgi:hypothetical protein
MKQHHRRHRRPAPDGQHVLEHLTVRPVHPHEIQRLDQLIVAHHYLKSAELVGQHLRHVATYQGQWLALAAWSAAALHRKPRDAFILNSAVQPQIHADGRR